MEFFYFDYINTEKKLCASVPLCLCVYIIEGKCGDSRGDRGKQIPHCGLVVAIVETLN
jgi:hypothetical protein